MLGPCAETWARFSARSRFHYCCGPFSIHNTPATTRLLKAGGSTRGPNVGLEMSRPPRWAGLLEMVGGFSWHNLGED